MSSAATEARNLPEEAWGGPNPSRCDDLVWWELTGMCGGCGDDDCHDGPCGESYVHAGWFGWERLVCDKCQYRKDQGLVR
jgi:hypothetical protein